MDLVRKLTFGFKRSESVILQTEATECGLACLAMVLAHHGYESDLPTLRRKVSLSLKGTTLKQLIEIAQRLGLTARPMRLELSELGELPTPAILHWDFSHFVVPSEVKGDRATIIDPAWGKRTLPLSTISSHFTGVAICFSPSATFEVKKEVRTFSWRTLIGSTKGLTRSLFQVGLLALVLEILVVVGPLLNQWLFDHVIVTRDSNLLIVLALGLFALDLIRTVINIVRGWAVMVMSASLNLQWVANVFAHLLRLPISWFEKRHIGDVTSRFNAIHTIQGTLTTRAIETVLDGLMSVAALVVMLVYHRTLSFCVMGGLALYTISRFAWYGALRRLAEARLVFEAKQQSYLLETLRALRTVRLFNATDDRRTRWLNLLVDERNAGLRGQRYGIVIEAGNSLLFNIQNTALLWIGAKGVIEGNWTLGMMLAFLSYKDQFVGRASGLVDKLMELRMLRVHGERLADIVLTETEPEHLGSQDPKTLVPSLAVQGVSFKYGDQEPWVLRGLSVSVEPGQMVAFIGPSGSGKTTLMKVMLGLLEPQEGEVQLGGVRLDQVGTREFRDEIGVVMQDDQLVSGSIAENIALGITAPDIERIEQVAKVAAIYDEIRAMPMGFHTLVGDMGTTLSGGQKQRVLLARALYRGPRILFLDEATSHLDTTNESYVNAAVRSLGLTSVVIAHRPETIRMADRIIVVEAGQAFEVDREKFSVLSGAQKAPTQMQLGDAESA